MNYLNDKDYLNNNKLAEILNNINENSLLVVNKLQKIKDIVFRSEEAENLRILTSEQVEQILDVSSTTLKRLIQEGLLPTRKIMSRYYFYEMDIHNLLQSKRTDYN